MRARALESGQEYDAEGKKAFVKNFNADLDFAELLFRMQCRCNRCGIKKINKYLNSTLT